MPDDWKMEMPEDKGPALPSEIEKAVAIATAEINANRDEIFAAFMAKYGCGPDEVEQVFEAHPETRRMIWYLRRRAR